MDDEGCPWAWMQLDCVLGVLAWGSGLGPPHSELGRGPKLRALDDGDALGFGEGWPWAGGLLSEVFRWQLSIW